MSTLEYFQRIFSTPLHSTPKSLIQQCKFQSGKKFIFQDIQIQIMEFRFLGLGSTPARLLTASHMTFHVTSARPIFIQMRQVVIEHEQHDDPIITLLKQFNALGQFRALINPYCSRGERYGAKREPLSLFFEIQYKLVGWRFSPNNRIFKANIFSLFLKV